MVRTGILSFTLKLLLVIEAANYSPSSVLASKKHDESIGDSPSSVRFLKSKKASSKKLTKTPKSGKSAKAHKSGKSSKMNSLKIYQRGANFPDENFCYLIPSFNAQGDQVGTISDCVSSEIVPLDPTFSSFQFNATIIFTFETNDDEFTTSCLVTVLPRDQVAEGDVYNAISTCYSANGVIGGKGVYEGAAGSVTLNGLVNNTQFGGTGELNFNLEWEIQLN